MNRRAFVLGAAMVLLTNLVTVALRAYSEAAFIAAYGKSSLPWLLIAIATGFAVATLSYDQITRRAHTRVVDVWLLVVLLAAAATTPSLLTAGASPAAIVVALVATSQVAGLALWNRVAASVAGRDARRMLPRAGAAVTTGGVIAGLGAGVLIPRVGATILPYVGAGVTAIILVLCLAQAKALDKGDSPGATAPPGTPERLGELQRRLLVGLIAVAMLEGIVATVIDLQFLGALKARFKGDELATAISVFYGCTNAVLLLLQATAVPRILVTRSVPFTAAIHPVLVILGYATFAIAPGFVNIAGTRTADQVLRLATSRTSQEIELSAFPPAPRARWKVLLRGAVWPAGAALAALILLVIGPRVTEHAVVLAGAGIGVAFVWWIAGQITARRFQRALAAPLGIKATRRDDMRIDLETLERWAAAAGSDDPRVAALARAALVRARVDATDLADHLMHEEAFVRVALFEQFALAPSAALRNELKTAVALEQDDHALARGIKALALIGDDSGIDIAASRAVVAREVTDAVRAASLALRGTGDAAAEFGQLCERDPQWAIALARRAVLPADQLAAVLVEAAHEPARRIGALVVIAHVGSGDSLVPLATALDAGEPDASAAIASLDAEGAAHLAANLTPISSVGRAIAARALAGAPQGTALVATLLGDPDPEVAYAALRTALAIAGGGGKLPTEPIARALESAKAALVAYLDARDAVAAADAAAAETAAAEAAAAEAAATAVAAEATPLQVVYRDAFEAVPAPPAGWSAPCARFELELATRRCVARLLWGAAVEAAATGRDPAQLTATARHLIGGREADRRRALDVVQELQAGRMEILAVIERWIRPAAPNVAATFDALRTTDPWLARLGDGELVALESTITVLRRPALLSTVAGPALADLAVRARRERITGIVFREGDDGDTMYVVADGALIARRTGFPERRVEPGGVVGELAVLTHAPRAATVETVETGAEVVIIDRVTFTNAARRAPELVLGLSATLAGWIAPNRPDLL